jgi:hypothetical protein
VSVASPASPTSPDSPATGAGRRWPWIVGVGSLAVFAAANLLYPADDADLGFTVMFAAILSSFVVVGAILTTRVPGNAVGPVLLLSGAVLATTIAIGTMSIAAASSGALPPEIVALAGVINDAGFTLPIIVVLIGIPLIFPDGRLLSPRWRWIVGLAVVAYSATVIAQLLGPSPVGPTGIPNPFAIPALFPLVEILDAFADLTSVIGFGAAITAVVLRYRRGDPIERQQLKWPAASVALALAFPIAFVLPASPIADAAFLLGMVALLTLPMAIGIAVARYRLYEIDRIISRTLSWAIVTAVLVAVFAVLLIGLQALLEGLTQSGGTLAVAASTLVAFALFQPLRRRVQRAVDRRFDRARYDGERTAAAFAERLRDEVDLRAVEVTLTDSIDRSLRPVAVALWLRDPVDGLAR